MMFTFEYSLKLNLRCFTGDNHKKHPDGENLLQTLSAPVFNYNLNEF